MLYSFGTTRKEAMKLSLKRVAVVAGAVGLVALAIGATASQSGASTTGHQETTTKTVAWVTPNDPAGPQVTVQNVKWPQSLFTGDPYACGTPAWLQIDVYKYDDQYKDAVDALIKGGVLAKVNGQPADSAFVISWKFVLIKPCEESTPPPPSSSSTPPPPPSSSTPPPPPSSNTPPPSSDTPPPSSSSTPPPVTSSAPPTKTSTVNTPPDTSISSTPPPVLASTGAAGMSWLIPTGGGLVVVGIIGTVIGFARRQGNYS